MNLEELQIKVSIELKDLEKQLKSITKSIDKTLGPQTTKRLMQSTHRVIKNESLAINKTLNKAFEVDYKSFNNNLNAAMNQAKLTVRSACNDIRRELNSALNVKANIRVTGKTSIDGSATGKSSGSTTASSMASSQYIGAMIIKATNEVIKVNNTNAKRLESSLKSSTKDIVSAIKKIKINIETTSTNTNDNPPKDKGRNRPDKPNNLSPDNGEDAKIKKIAEVIEKAIKDIQDKIISSKQQQQQQPKKTSSETPEAKEMKKIPVGESSKDKPNKTKKSSPVVDEDIDTEEKIKSKIDKAFDSTKKSLKSLQDKLSSVFDSVEEIAPKAEIDPEYEKKYGKKYAEKHAKQQAKREKKEEKKKRKQEARLEELKNFQPTPKKEKSKKVIVDKEAHERMEAMKEAWRNVFNPPDSSDIDKLKDITPEEFKKQTEALKKAWEEASDPDQIEEDLKKLFNSIRFTAALVDPINAFLADVGLVISKELLSSINSPEFDYMQKIKDQMENGVKDLKTYEEFKEHKANSPDKFTGSTEKKEEKTIKQKPFAGAFKTNEEQKAAMDEFNKKIEEAQKEWLKAVSSIDRKSPKEAIDEFNEKTKAMKDAWAKASDPEQIEKDLENIIDAVKIARGIADPINEFFADLGGVIVKELAKSIKSPAYDYMQEMKDRMKNGGKNPEADRQGFYSKSTSFKMGDSTSEYHTGKVVNPSSVPMVVEQVKQFKQIPDIIEGVWREIDSIDLSLDSKIGQLSLPVATESQLEGIQERIKQISEEFENIWSELSSVDSVWEASNSVKDFIPTLKEMFDILNQIDDERLKINLDTTDAQQRIEALKASIDMAIEACDTNNINKVREFFDTPEKQTQKPKPQPPKPKRTSGDGLDDYASKVEKLSARLDDAADDLMEVTRILGSIDDAMSDNGIGDLEQCEEVLRKLSQTDLSRLNRDIKSLAESFSGGDFDTSDIDKLVNRLKALKEIRERLNAINKNAQKGKGIDSGAIDTQFRAIKNYKNVSFGEGDSGTLNFLPYKIQFDKIAEYARKAGSKVKEALSGAFNKTKGSVSKFAGEAKSALGEAFSNIKPSKIYNSIKPALSKAKTAVSKFAGTVKPILKKAFEIKINIYKGIDHDLKLIKKALVKFASGCKSLWNKIKSIFHKGSKDSGDATGTLKGKLKDLLKQIASFATLASLIALGKEAIQQSTQLAQSEVKLASLMKQRMGATNETVTAIRQLAEEQAKLGVVSETAMKNGAQQLARYVHSAKALKELMPAMANLTAARGGVMATPEDAEEIATQLGEAIREGTTTPLEQSGIYLSEAEIAKFQALTTEEARAAYLADVIAKNVGNINQALANTPHGAIAQLKNNFQSLLGTLGIFLANVIKPIVQGLNVIVVACNNALKALGKLLGFDMTGGATTVPDIGTGDGSTPEEEYVWVTPDGIYHTEEAYEAAKKAADEATEANEKFKGSLMGFDEINILSDNTNKNKKEDDFDPTDITPGEGGQLTPSLPAVGDLKETDSVFSKLSGKFKAFMDEILEPFKNAWDLLGDRWIKAAEENVAALMNFCKALKDLLVSVWEHGGKEFVQHLAEIGLACGIAAMEIESTILNALAELWRHLDPKTNMNTQGFIDALNEAEIAIRDFILSLGPLFKSFMANGGQDLLNAIGDLAMNVGKLLANMVKEVAECMTKFFEHMDPATNKNSKNALESLKNLVESISDFVNMLGESISLFMDSGGQAFVNNLGDIIAIIIDLAATIAGGVIDNITDFFNSWAGHLVLQAVAKSLEIISGALELLLKAIKPLTPLISDLLTGFLAYKALTGIASTITKVVTAIGKLKGISTIVEWVGKLVTAFKNLGGVSGILTLVKGGFTALWGVISAHPIAAIITAIAAIGVALYNTNDDFKKFIDNILGGFEGVFDKIKEYGGKLFENVKEIFGSVVDIITGIFEGDGYKVGEAVRNLITNILELIYNLNQSFVEIGWELIKGLVKGIWECVKAIPDLLMGIGEFILDFFAGLFGVDGDALVETGEKLIDGLVKGVSGAIDKVTEVFTKVKDAVVNPVKDIAEKASEGWQSFTDKTKEVFGSIGDTIGEAWDSIKEYFSNGYENVSNTTGEKWNGIKESFSEGCENISNTVGGWIDTFSEKWSEITGPISENLSTAVSNASEKFGELREELSGILDDFIERNKERWERIKADTSEKIGPVVDDVVDKYTKMKDSTNETLDEIMKASEEAWAKVKEKIMEKLEPVIDYVSGVWNRTKEACVGVWNDIETSCSESWNRVKDECIEIWNNIKDECIAVWDRTKEACKNAWDDIATNVSDSWNRVKDECSKTWNNVKDACIDVWNKTKDECIEIWNRTSEACVEAWNDVEKECSEAWDRVSDECVKVWNDIKDKCIDIWNSISDYLVEAWTRTKDDCAKIWDDTTKFFSDMWNSIESTCKKAWDSVSDYLTDVWNRTKEDCEKIWDDTAKFFSDTWDKVSDTCEKTWNNIKDKATDIWTKTKDKVTDIWDRTAEACKGAWEDVEKSCTDSWNRVKDSCGEVWGNIKDTITEKMSGIKDFFTDLWEDIKDIFGSMADDVTQFVGPKWDAVVDFFEDIGKKIGDAISATLLIIPGMIKDLFNVDIFDPIREGLENGLEWLKQGGGLLEKAYSVGQFLIEGLCDGIMTTVEAIGTFLEGIGDIVIGFFKDLFGIHSPSTVFAELGVNLIEGLIVGIESMFEAIGEIITQLSDTILGAFSGLGDKLSETWENIKKNTSDTWNKIKEDVSKLISDIKKDAEDKYNKLKEKLTDTMENWRKNSEDKWNKIKEKTASLVDTLKKDAEDKYNKLKDKLTTTMENWRKNSEDKWNNIKNKTTELAENLKTTVEDKYNRFKQALTNTLENLRSTSQEKWTNIKDKTTELAENLKSTVEDKFNTLKTNLASKMSDIKSDMETKWNNIKERATSLVENLRSTVEEKFNTLKTNLASKMSEIKSNIETKWGEIKTNAINKASEVVTNVTTKYGELKTNVTNKMAEVKSNAKTKWEELKTDAKSGAEGMVKKAGEGLSGLSKTLTDAIDKAKTAAGNAWDKLKNVFSGSSFNFPKLPKVKIEWETITGNNWFPDIKFPKLSWNARGGIIDGITPLGFANGALQMGGEAGKEMIVPLEQTSFTSKIAQAMGQAVDNALARQSNPYNNSYNTTNDNRDIVLQINEREFARCSINSINKLQRESGKTLLNI